MEEKECCGTCRHHLKHVWAGPGDKHKDEWWCSNEEADAYGDFTAFSDGTMCLDYEDRDG